MDIYNSLSAKYVKVHGMSSDKWTTKDKITQYKGLVNLFKRDRAVTLVDTSVAAKKQHRNLVTLRKTIELDRKELDNAIAGDRQGLRNTLAEHRDMQLAYQNTPPKKVVENINQFNFTKRKELDKLSYQMNQKCQRLIDLKLEEALLEDRLKYEELGEIKEEKIAEIITGKVQDAILKREAALAIQQSYAQIINIMKKDSLYFNNVLTTMENDCTNQAKCILSATKQGQLATEYKDDRQQEFETLEAAVVADMKVQKRDLELVREQAENASSELKHLLRRDSDLTTCIVNVVESHETMQLHKDMEKIETTLNFLKDSTLVSSFELIYPCMTEQLKQNERLTALARKCERKRDIIMNKLDHAQLMNNMLENTMVETTGEYKTRKKELLKGIHEENEKMKAADEKIKFKHILIAKVRLCLRQIQQLSKPIKRVDEKKAQVDENVILPQDDKPVVPEIEECDGLKIIAGLTSKLTFLMSNVPDKFEQHRLDDAFKFYEHLMKDRSISTDIEAIKPDSLLEGFVSEVSHLLTREDIKRISDEIVKANTKNDDLVPLFQVKKKKKKF